MDSDYGGRRRKVNLLATYGNLISFRKSARKGDEKLMSATTSGGTPEAHSLQDAD
jgi:hypothetical protein